MLLHGNGGVGKDVTAAEVVHQPTIAGSSTLTVQAWLLGSSDDVFRRQLVSFFAARLPTVLTGCADNQPEALARIKSWLAANDGWLLVVEDATVGCTALTECLPPGRGKEEDGSGRGHVLFTSREPLQTSVASLGISAALELAVLDLPQCVQVLRNMGIFTWGGKATSSTTAASSEGRVCACVWGIVCPHTLGSRCVIVLEVYTYDCPCAQACCVLFVCFSLRECCIPTPARCPAHTLTPLCGVCACMHVAVCVRVCSV